MDEHVYKEKKKKKQTELPNRAHYSSGINPGSNLVSMQAFI